MSSISAGTTSTTTLVHSGDTTGSLVFKTNDTGSGGTTAVTIDTSQNLQFNSGYGSVATAYGCRVWVLFNGVSGISIRGSGNVSSVTRVATGNYTVNFTNAMPDANYCAVMSAKTSTGAVSRVTFSNGDYVANPSTSSYNFYTTTLAGTPTDTDYVSFAVFR